MKLQTTILLGVILSAAANMRCSSDAESKVPKYHIMEKCHRSKLGIVAKVNYSSITSCHRLGVEKKALALNFSPLEAMTEGGEPLEYTCEVLKCAESDGGLSLMNDTRYDYYSIYAKPIPHLNSTCVPGIGMFYLPPKRHNFTQALEECRNASGVLAAVTSEQRTDALSQMLAGASVDAALVGLRRNNGTSFRSTNGDPIDCTTYRAWEPGHPRRNVNKFDCVLLTRRRTWRTASCNKRHQVLCELLPGGPYKRGAIFASRKPSLNDNTTVTTTERSKEKF